MTCELLVTARGIDTAFMHMLRMKATATRKIRRVPGEGEGADRRERADGVNALPPSGAGRNEDSFEGLPASGHANRESREHPAVPPYVTNGSSHRRASFHAIQSDSARLGCR
jgi:hypothetical protein